MNSKVVKEINKTNFDGMKKGMNKYKTFSVYSINNVKNIEDIKW